MAPCRIVGRMSDAHPPLWAANPRRVARASHMLLPGETFEGYLIDRELGRGGVGIVYKATQLSLNRVVALKLLAPELNSDPEVQARFRNEGITQAAIAHPNVVPVYESGEHDGQLFLAMKYIEGNDLKRLIRKRQARARGGDPHPRPGRRGAGRRAPARLRPPRRQVPQHPDRRRRPRLPGRLRADEGRRRPHARRRDRRHAGLPRSRADRGPAGDAGQRRLRARRGPARMPDRAAARAGRAARRSRRDRRRARARAWPSSPSGGRASAGELIQQAAAALAGDTIETGHTPRKPRPSLAADRRRRRRRRAGDGDRARARAADRRRRPQAQRRAEPVAGRPSGDGSRSASRAGPPR